MKRVLIILTVALSLISLSSFAEGMKDISPKAVKAFNSSFKNVTEVSWSIADNFYKASFSMNGQYVTAYYDADGNRKAVTRNISSLQLPITLQAELQKSYDNFWITDLFELADANGTSYYITLENANDKIVLKSNSSRWETFQKQSKS